MGIMQTDKAALAMMLCAGLGACAQDGQANYVEFSIDGEPALLAISETQSVSCRFTRSPTGQVDFSANLLALDQRLVGLTVAKQDIPWQDFESHGRAEFSIHGKDGKVTFYSEDGKGFSNEDLTMPSGRRTTTCQFQLHRETLTNLSATVDCDDMHTRPTSDGPAVPMFPISATFSCTYTALRP